jgi:hypothetical protein
MRAAEEPALRPLPHMPLAGARDLAADSTDGLGTKAGLHATTDAAAPATSIDLPGSNSGRVPRSSERTNVCRSERTNV